MKTRAEGEWLSFDVTDAVHEWLHHKGYTAPPPSLPRCGPTARDRMAGADRTRANDFLNFLFSRQEPGIQDKFALPLLYLRAIE